MQNLFYLSSLFLFVNLYVCKTATTTLLTNILNSVLPDDFCNVFANKLKQIREDRDSVCRYPLCVMLILNCDISMGGGEWLL